MLALFVSAGRGQSVSPSESSYAVGEDIVIAFAGGPGNAADWIAVYPQGITPDGDPRASLWFYTNGTKTAGGSIASGNMTFASPSLAEGNYSAWFLSNDGYTVRSRVNV